MEGETWELPPAEHPIGVYLGLVLSFIILGIGSVVLFLSIYSLFQTEGFRLTSDFVGRILLFFGSSYGAIAALTALYKIVKTQSHYSKKVEKEFRDFTVYARPLVEEVIRQRVVSQRISEQLEQLKKTQEIVTPSETSRNRWNETLVLIAILGNASVGLYLFLDRYPWELVPYSLIFLAFGWWLVIARHFDLISETRSYYIPAIYILIVPTLSIVLRAYLELHQVLFFVFFSLVPYIISMYTYYSYIALGKLPSYVPEKFFGKELENADLSKEKKYEENDAPEGLKKFMPPNNKGE